MSSSHDNDTFPRKDAEFDIFFRNVLNYTRDQTVGASPRWTHIPQAEIDNLASRYDEWTLAYTQVKGPHTSQHTKRKNAVKKTAIKALQNFLNAYIRYHPAVTDYDREQMGVHVHDPNPSPVPIHETPPVIVSVIPLPGGIFKIRFQDVDNPERRAIPKGCNGCVLFFGISDRPITDRDELKETVLMTRNPYTLVLTGENLAGKFFSCAAAWQIKKGFKGKKSEIHSTVIVD
jgi:hypothetical protein